MSYLQVIIVTNSDEGWVDFSARKYCPQLLPVVQKYRIISARTGYEKFYPGQPLCWKAAAFAHEVNEIYEKLSQRDDSSSDGVASLEGTDVSSTSSLDPMDTEDNTGSSFSSPPRGNSGTDMKREIISFGDSHEERTAVNIVSKQFNATSKSIMFMNAPSLLQIIGQLHMLTNHMRFVCDNTSSLDLQITSEQADRCAYSYLKERQISYDHTIVPTFVPRIRQSLTAATVSA